MKICFPFLNFEKHIFNGVQNSLHNLAAGFREHGIDVSIYTSASRKTKPIDSVHVYRSDLLPSSFPEDLLNAENHLQDKRNEINEEFCSFLQQERVDYVIAFDPLWGILQTTDAWKCVPCPSILSLHNLNSAGQLIKADAIPYLFIRSVSNFLKREVEKYIKTNRILVIPNSIDTKKFRPIAEDGYKSHIVFCNSRISSQKGIDYLLFAFAEFLRHYPKHELWLCGGDSPQEDDRTTRRLVQRKIRTLDIQKRVNFLPDLSWDEIPDIICHSFTVVLPTLYETFGRSAIESLACGTPLIASNVGNLPELVNDAAILVPPRSPTAICESLTKLREDPDCYQKLALLGPSVAANYDNIIVAGDFLKALTGQVSPQVI